MNKLADDQALRGIELEGPTNFRDLGGIRTRAGVTRRGVVYRSDRLSNLTAADGERLRQLRIATIIDMRIEDERERAPNRLPESVDAQQISHPFLPRHTLPMFEAINSGACDPAAAHETMIRQYEALTLDHAEDYGRIIENLLEPGKVPAIVHCTSGKDRTGMVAAIILLAIGTPRAAVIADYAMTQGRIEKVEYFEDGADPDVVEVVMAAKPAYIGASFAAMESRFGSVESYLREAVGLTPPVRRQLRALLVDT